MVRHDVIKIRRVTNENDNNFLIIDVKSGVKLLR